MIYWSQNGFISVETGLFLISDVRPLTLNICTEEFNGEIPVLLKWFWSGTQKRAALDQTERRFEPGSPTFSTVTTGPIIHSQIFLHLSASVRMSAGFGLFIFYRYS